MKRLLALLPLVVVLLVPAPPPAAAGYWRHCGDQPETGAGWYKVRARKVGCHTARELAQRWTASADAGNATPHPLGFTCQRFSPTYGEGRVACSRAVRGPDQKVRFELGP